MIRNIYLDRSAKYKKQYKNFASNNWEFSKWIRDCFNPTNTQGDVYDLLVNSDNSKPWEQAHKIEFEYQNKRYSTNTDNFRDFYMDICNTDENNNYQCTVTIDEIREEVSNDDVLFNHHLYEGISKYNMYFAGWNDSEQGYVETLGSNYQVAYSPNKLYYENTLRARHKKNDKNAGYVLSTILVTHIISMFDILLDKNNTNMSINYDVSYNKNYSGINFSVGLN